MVIIVSLLLALCVTVDYATNDSDIIISNDTGIVIPENTTLINGSYVLPEDAGVAKLQSVVTEKPKLPIISMWAKPSVRSKYAYKWYKKTFINYCPNCGHYNCLLKNPKMVPEREYTCAICDSDFCAVTGKEKYSWAHVYLRKA